MRLEKGQKLVNITKTAKEEEPEETEAIDSLTEGSETEITAPVAEENEEI